jgi:maltose/maltodextrin transport system substrate-binding protein/arabinogalactan oligomer/maltooligosaccharide transport system substrate-binding protein
MAPTEAPAAGGACPAGSPTLTIWADDQRAPVLQDLSAQVLAETGVCLDIQEVGFGDIRSNVSLAAPAGEGPDIFVGANDWLGELAANGVPAEMDLGAKAADFDPVALEAFSFGGKLLGLPYAVENVAFVCNADLVPTPPATYDELKTMAQEMQDAGTVQQFFALMAGDPYHQESILTAFDGYIFGVTEAGYDACDVGLDSQGAIDYLTWIDGMVKDGLLSADVNWDTAHTLFDSGDAACMITGPWAIERFQDAGINYSIGTMPAQVQPGSPMVGVQGFMVNAFSDDRVLAQSFLVDYIATQPVMEAFYEAGNRPPAYLPARGVMDETAQAFAAVAETGHPQPNIVAMSSVYSSWGDAIVTVFQQSATPEQAATTAAQQVRDASGCP